MKKYEVWITGGISVRPKTAQDARKEVNRIAREYPGSRVYFRTITERCGDPDRTEDREYKLRGDRVVDITDE
jgi:hypothetical protein